MQSPWQQNQWPLERWIRQELSLAAFGRETDPQIISWLPIGCMLFFFKRLGFMLRHGVSGETSTSRPVYSCFRCGVILTNRAEVGICRPLDRCRLNRYPWMLPAISWWRTLLKWGFGRWCPFLEWRRSLRSWTESSVQRALSEFKPTSFDSGYIQKTFISVHHESPL